MRENGQGPHPSFVSGADGVCPNNGQRPWQWCCGYCWYNVHGRSNYRGHVNYIRPEDGEWSWKMGKYLKKHTATSESGSGPVALKKGERERFEGLLEMMETVKWEDGKPRQTTTVTLFVDAGGVKACANDRDAERSAWVTGESFLHVLELLEKGIREDTLDWRQKQGGYQGKKSGRRA